MKRTKIVCTLGPASHTPEMLETMIEHGMDVARLNFSHGNHRDHQQMYARVRRAAQRVGRPVAVLQDLQGPKIRVARLTGGQLELAEGQIVRIAHATEQDAAGVIPTTYEHLATDVKPGDSILMDDGLIRMRVERVEGEQVHCLVQVGGTLKDRKGINLPGVAVSAPALTDKDKDDLAFGATLQMDFVCLSFVRRPADITLARELLAAAGRSTPIIAKIEKPEAVERLDAILDATDGAMVARGDLGVELGPEKVPLIQKRLIEQTNRRGKIVITATQMLESMVSHSFPTRAEASDVANAVLDQTDAVMLSAETATGAHPPLVIDTMRRIIEEVESSDRYRRAAQLPPLDQSHTPNAIAHAAAAAAASLDDVRTIVCLSAQGITPTLLSDYRPTARVLALVSEPTQANRLATFWGIEPVLFPLEGGEDTEGLIARADAMLLERGLVDHGERVVLTLAVPPGEGRRANTLKVHRVGAKTDG